MMRESVAETAQIIGLMRAWLDTVQLVPPALAPYAPLVIDGLLFFLERLPGPRLEAIVGDQLALGDEATADDRLVALLRRCPTLHKLGQVIAHEPGLPRELRERLQGLESLAPPPGNADIGELIERELGHVRGLMVSADALAEGSVAFIVPFEWDAAPAGLPKRGVFKALKPHAREHLLEDLALWPALGDFLEDRSAADGVTTFAFRSTLDGVAKLLLNEIELDREQQRLDWARRFYADTPRVLIPQLLPLCTARLTAMERIDGRKITESGRDAPARRAFAQTLVDALLAKPFWSPPSADVVFHADPHAGNVFACDDGRVAIFDWALTTQLDEAQLAAVVQTLLGAATLDESAVMRAIAQLGEIRSEPALRGIVAAAVADVRRGVFPGFDWLTPLLDNAARKAIVVFPEATALFRKSLLTLTSVVRDVSPAVSIDQVIIAAGGRRFVGEAALRSLAPFDSRAFGTHISNADVLGVFAAAAWTPTRYAFGAYSDMLKPFEKNA